MGDRRAVSKSQDAGDGSLDPAFAGVTASDPRNPAFTPGDPRLITPRASGGPARPPKPGVPRVDGRRARLLSRYLSVEQLDLYRRVMAAPDHRPGCVPAMTDRSATLNCPI